MSTTTAEREAIQYLAASKLRVCRHCHEEIPAGEYIVIHRKATIHAMCWGTYMDALLERACTTVDNGVRCTIAKHPGHDGCIYHFTPNPAGNHRKRKARKRRAWVRSQQQLVDA